MTAPSDPTPGAMRDGAPTAPAERPPDPLAGPDQPTEPRHRAWAWIAACAVLALVAVGVTIWALSLNSDLNDQRDQTAAAQEQADKASSDVDQLTQDVNDALDQAGQAGAEAKDKLQGVLADLKDRLGALTEDSKPPAEGSGTPEAAVSPTATATATAVENATPDGE